MTTLVLVLIIVFLITLPIFFYCYRISVERKRKVKRVRNRKKAELEKEINVQSLQGDATLSVQEENEEDTEDILDGVDIDYYIHLIAQRRAERCGYYPIHYDEYASGIVTNDRDPLFDEAAFLVVLHQQGSPSLIQRKLSIGYNRACRIMDQLEAVGIVGLSQGSTIRDVLIDTESPLMQGLNDDQ